MSEGFGKLLSLRKLDVRCGPVGDNLPAQLKGQPGPSRLRSAGLVLGKATCRINKAPHGAITGGSPSFGRRRAVSEGGKSTGGPGGGPLRRDRELFFPELSRVDHGRPKKAQDTGF